MSRALAPLINADSTSCFSPGKPVKLQKLATHKWTRPFSKPRLSTASATSGKNRHCVPGRFRIAPSSPSDQLWARGLRLPMRFTSGLDEAFAGSSLTGDCQRALSSCPLSLYHQRFCTSHAQEMESTLLRSFCP